MNEKKNFSALMGRLVAYALSASIAACMIAVIVALTVRFIAWLF